MNTMSAIATLGCFCGRICGARLFVCARWQAAKLIAWGSGAGGGPQCRCGNRVEMFKDFLAGECHQSLHLLARMALVCGGGDADSLVSLRTTVKCE